MTKLDKEDDSVQVSTLIHALGGEAENIFSSFTFSAKGDHKNYELVLKKFDSYFISKRNVIHERACFYQHVQRAGERECNLSSAPFLNCQSTVNHGGIPRQGAVTQVAAHPKSQTPK